MNAGNRDLKAEIAVGGFAFAVILGLFVFSIFVTGEVFFKSGRMIEIDFSDVMGLRKGDSVIVRGMTVGDVKDIDLRGRNGTVRVYCSLQQPVDLRGDASAIVVPTSILGGRQVHLEAGSAAERLPHGTPVPGRTPNDLMGDAARIVALVKDALDKDGGLEDMKAILSETREIVRKVNEGEGTFGRLVNDSTLYDDLLAAVRDIKGIGADIRDGKGTIAKLLQEDDIYEDLRSSSENIKTISQRLVDGKGMLGRLMDDNDTMYADTKLLLQDVRAAVDDFRETSPVLTFTSIFLGAF